MVAAGASIHWVCRPQMFTFVLRTSIATIGAAPGWEAELDRTGVGTVLLPIDVGLDRAFQDDTGWREAYRDTVAVVFVRS